MKKSEQPAPPEIVEQFVEQLTQGKYAQVSHLIDTYPALSESATAEGLSLILLTAYHRQPSFSSQLFRGKTNPDIYERIIHDDLPGVEAILTETPLLVNQFAPDGFTPLTLAAYFGHSALAKLLLSVGADVNLATGNPMRVAPIHAAVASQAIAIVGLLLDAGADVQAVQSQGITPLHAAAHRGDELMVKTLLKAGAPAATRSDAGFSAADYAEQGGFPALATQLRSYEAQ
ncbi:MAG: ankyrin repeat domain-containing protein [Lewinellaceae bacterium]|nr:ankyrin repeat domain-containing protein [Lewinellaceae bacterium]